MSDSDSSPIVRFETDRGSFRVELFEDATPETARNFRKLAEDGFYDGVAFHRVIDGFVVQGGDPQSRDLPVDDPRVGSGGPGYTIDCETDAPRQRHATGALSMAHAGRDTGGSQFFIVLDEASARHLDGVHTVFGQVVEGMEVVDSIRRGDRMVSVRLEESGE